MGRKPVQLSAAQKAEVETLAAVLTTEQIADFFGIGRRTFYSLMERDDEIAARYKRGKARAIGAIAQTLIGKARAGDTTSMIFYLKTQAGWRETTNVKVAADPGEENPADVAFDALAAVLDLVANRQGGSGDGGSRSDGGEVFLPTIGPRPITDLMGQPTRG